MLSPFKASIVLVAAAAFSVGYAVDIPCDIDEEHKNVTFLPDYTDCSKYYECAEGILVHQSCPAGLWWNHTLNVCDWSWDVDCGDASTPSGGQTTKPPVTATTKSSEKPTQSTVTPSIPTTPTPGDTCPATGVHYYPNYYDCYSFYECKDGEKTLMSCPPNYAWSVAQGACRPKEEVSCDFTSPSTSRPTSAPDVCPASGTSYLPDYSDCTSYYVCNGGTKTIEHCKYGYAWNPLINACDDKDYVDCSYVTISTTPQSTPTGLTGTTGGFTPDPSCPYPSPGATYNASSTDCSHFSVCRNGKRTELECPTQYLWDDSKKACYPKSEVDCGFTSPSTSRPTSAPDTDATSPAPTTTAIPEFECPATGGPTYWTYPYNCSQYYECNDGVKTLRTCNNSELWNPPISACDLPENVDCSYTSISPITPTVTSKVTTGSPTTTATPTPTPVVSCTGKPDGTLLANPKNCNGYIECLNGKTYAISCSPGTVWDDDIQKCTTGTCTNNPAAVSCTGKADDTHLADPNNCNGYIVCINGKIDARICPYGTIWDDDIPDCTTGTCTNNLAANLCESQKDGTIFADSRNCHNFIECVKGREVSKACANGTVWDDDHKICTFGDCNPSRTSENIGVMLEQHHAVY